MIAVGVESNCMHFNGREREGVKIKRNALRVSKHVTESIRNIARGVATGIN